MSTTANNSESYETLQQVFEISLNQVAEIVYNQNLQGNTSQNSKDSSPQTTLLQPRTFDAEWRHFHAWMQRPAHWNKANQSNCDHGLNAGQVVALSEHVLKRKSTILGIDILPFSTCDQTIISLRTNKFTSVVDNILDTISTSRYGTIDLKYEKAYLDN